MAQNLQLFLSRGRIEGLRLVRSWTTGLVEAVQRSNLGAFPCFECLPIRVLADDEQIYDDDVEQMMGIHDAPQNTTLVGTNLGELVMARASDALESENREDYIPPTDIEDGSTVSPPVAWQSEGSENLEQGARNSAAISEKSILQITQMDQSTLSNFAGHAFLIPQKGGAGNIPVIADHLAGVRRSVNQNESADGAFISSYETPEATQTASADDQSDQTNASSASTSNINKCGDFTLQKSMAEFFRYGSEVDLFAESKLGYSPEPKPDRLTENQSQILQMLFTPLRSIMQPYYSSYISSFQNVQVYSCPCGPNPPHLFDHPHEINGYPWNQFGLYKKRLASFRYYPPQASKSAFLLANFGFVYIGNEAFGASDRVMCFFCGAVKENWQYDEDIEQVHRVLSQNTCIMLPPTLE